MSLLCIGGSLDGQRVEDCESYSFAVPKAESGGYGAETYVRMVFAQHRVWVLSTLNDADAMEYLINRYAIMSRDKSYIASNPDTHMAFQNLLEHAKAHQRQNPKDTCAIHFSFVLGPVDGKHDGMHLGVIEWDLAQNHMQFRGKLMDKFAKWLVEGNNGNLD